MHSLHTTANVRDFFNLLLRSLTIPPSSVAAFADTHALHSICSVDLLVVHQVVTVISRHFLVQSISFYAITFDRHWVRFIWSTHNECYLYFLLVLLNISRSKITKLIILQLLEKLSQNYVHLVYVPVYVYLYTSSCCSFLPVALFKRYSVGI